MCLSRCGDKLRVQVVYDRAFFDALATPYKLFEPLCSYERYHELLDIANIALLPLEPTRFNEHKSDLKFIECAAHSVACLASPTVYEHTIVRRQDRLDLSLRSRVRFASGRIDHTTPSLTQQIGENARSYVAENRMLASHFRKRHDWYRNMLLCKQELEVELYARTPELRTTSA